MGRWGDGIYDSDTTLDYHGDITDRLEREFAQWLSPEAVGESGWWLAQVLAVVELQLLFESHLFSSSVCLMEAQPVQRWRDTFLGVWDGEWRDEESTTASYPYGEPEYRKQHRPAVAAMFDRMVSVARYWENLKSSEDPRDFVPLLPDYPLPYFSIRRWPDGYQKNGVTIERFTYDLLEHFLKDIIYYLSPEKRNEMQAFNVEEVWAAVDLLAFLCESYEQSPGINAKFILNWREAATEIWQRFLSGDKGEAPALYPDVIAAFDRLHAVAEKYPAYEW